MPASSWGGLAGATVGGALTTGLSWRWVFLINLPIGVVLVVVATMTLSGRRTGRQRLDLLGAFTGTSGLAALIYGVMHSSDHGWTTLPVVVLVAAGFLLLAAFVIVEARFAVQPMMPVRLLRLRGVAMGTGMLLMFGGITIAMWYFTSLFQQNVLGYGALEAGLGQTPAAVTFMVVARFAAGLLPRVGVRPLLLTGAVSFVVGFGWLSRADASSAYLTGILGPTLLVALGIGLTFPTLMAATTADVPASDAGIIGGLAQTASQTGGSIGLAVLATAASSATSGNSPTALATGYSRVFLIAAGLAVAIALTTLLLATDGRRR